MSAFLSKSKDMAEENKDEVPEDKEKGEGTTGEAPLVDEEPEEMVKPVKENDTAEVLPPPESENKNPPPNPYAQKKDTDSDEEF